MNVKALREQSHLTQEELSKISGISIRTIQRIEAGQEPKGHTARALAKALDIDLSAITKHKVSNETVDYSVIKLINLSSLFVTFIPLLNVIVPFLIMRFSKQKNRLAKTIISLQIFWTIISISIFFLVSFLKLTLSFSLRITQWVMIVLILINVVLILVNAYSLDRNRKLYIKLNFSFI